MLHSWLKSARQFWLSVRFSVFWKYTYLIVSNVKEGFSVHSQYHVSHFQLGLKEKKQFNFIITYISNTKWLLKKYLFGIKIISPNLKGMGSHFIQKTKMGHLQNIQPLKFDKNKLVQFFPLIFWYFMIEWCALFFSDQFWSNSPCEHYLFWPNNINKIVCKHEKLQHHYSY